MTAGGDACSPSATATALAAQTRSRRGSKSSWLPIDPLPSRLRRTSRRRHGHAGEQDHQHGARSVELASARSSGARAGTSRAAGRAPRSPRRRRRRRSTAPGRPRHARVLLAGRPARARAAARPQLRVGRGDRPGGAAGRPRRATAASSTTAATAGARSARSPGARPEPASSTREQPHAARRPVVAVGEPRKPTRGPRGRATSSRTRSAARPGAWVIRAGVGRAVDVEGCRPAATSSPARRSTSRAALGVGDARPGRRRRARVRRAPRRVPGGEQPALADDRHRVADLLHLGEDVRAEQHGDAGAAEVADQARGCHGCPPGRGRWWARRGCSRSGCLSRVAAIASRCFMPRE